MKAYNAYDTFVDADTQPITSHTSDYGYSWIRNTGFGSGVAGTIIGQRLQIDEMETALLLDYTPGSPDYTIEVTHYAGTASDNFCILARSADDTANCYALHYYAWGAIYISKCVDGTWSNIGGVSGYYPLNVPTVLRFTVNGSTLTADVGTAHVSVTDSTFQNVGKAGLAYGIVGGYDSSGSSTFDDFQILEDTAKRTFSTSVVVTPTLPLQTRLRKLLSVVTVSVVPEIRSCLMRRIFTTINTISTHSIHIILKNIIKRRIRF